MRTSSDSRCRMCAREVRFGLTWFLNQPGRQGKLMPVDLDAYELDDERANLACHTTDTGTFMVRVLGAGEAPLDHEHRRMPHFATCPTLARRRAAERVPDNVVSLDRYRR